MKINTENYENSNGSKPKPGQFGGWMFFILGRDGEACRFSHTGTYKEACTAAKAEARMIGRASGIVVCP